MPIALRPRTATATLPATRWAALGLLLAIEAMAVGAVFDPVPVPAVAQHWWAALIRRGGSIMPLATAMAAATWLLGDTALRAEVQRVSASVGTRRLWWPFLAGHLIAFALFVRLTGIVFGPGLAAAAHPGVWVLAWVAAALAAVGCWIACLLPGRVLWTLAGRLRTPLLAGVGVGAAAWAAGQVTEGWWDPLRRSTFAVVHAILALVVDDAVSKPADYIIGTPQFLVQIVPLCSGYQGIGLIWVFLAAYLWFFRRTLRFPHALLLLPIGTAVVWLTNAARIAALVLIGSHGWERVAVGGFHAYTGSLLFCGVALGMAGVARRSPFFAGTHAAARGRADDPATAYLLPFVAATAVTMLTASLSDGTFDPLYPLRVVVAGVALWTLRRGWRDMGWGWSWPAFLAGAAVFVLWVLLVSPPPAGEESPMLVGLSSLPQIWAAVWIVARLVGFVVTAPLVEELAFRGYLMRRPVSVEFERVPPRTAPWSAVIVSSLLFGAMHDWLVAGTVAGVLYAIVFRHRGRLGDAVLAHATTNALLAAFALLTGRWWLL